MASRSKGEELVEASQFAGASARANPLGDIIYVDSTNGSDGSQGKSDLHPVKTLTRAVALAAAGDTIICAAGGSETVTSSIAVAVAGLKIVCLADNPRYGFEINGAGALDLLTVSAAGVTLEGLKFDRAAAAGGATAAVLTTSAAHRLHVKGCVFDCSDSTSAWSNYGVELTEGLVDCLIEDCVFIDTHRGVLFAVSGSAVNKRTKIVDCDFWCGQATAFGVYAEPTGTAYVYGLEVGRCLFREVKGSGAAGANFDGTNNADATAGPMSLSANVDQFVSHHNYTDCASKNASFDTLNAIDGTGEYVGNETSTVSDIATTLAGQVTATSTDILSVGALTTSVGTAVSTDVLSAGVAASTDIKSVGALVTAIGVGPYATAAALSTQVIATSTDIKSVGTLTGTMATSAAVAAVGAQVSTDLVLTASVGTATSTAASNDVVATGSVGTLVSTDIVATGSVGTAASTAASNDVVDTASVGTLVSTDIVAAASVGTLVSTDIVATGSVGTVAGAAATGAGTDIALSKVFAASSIPNNTSTYALFTATGDVIVDQIVLSKDGTNLTGPTTVVLRGNNDYGPTGNTTDLFGNVLAGFNANLTVLASAGGATAMTFPYVIENGKALFIAGDDAAGADGNVKATVHGRRATAGASLA